MKTLKSIVMGFALLIICGAANAANKTNDKGPGKDEVIDTYLNAVVHGKLDGIDKAIDDGAHFNMTRGDNVNSLSKQQLLRSLKSTENIEQDCKCTSSVVRDENDICVRKVQMNYGDFTRTDLITAEREGKGWKITKVDISYN